MQQENQTHSSESTVSRPPWYRLPIVWLVIGGPAVVVVASLITVFIAVKNVDPVIDVTKAPSQPGLAPAVQGRNHAAEKTYQSADR